MRVSLNVTLDLTVPLSEIGKERLRRHIADAIEAAQVETMSNNWTAGYIRKVTPGPVKARSHGRKDARRPGWRRDGPWDPLS